jgi:hypothetical protein
VTDLLQGGTVRERLLDRIDAAEALVRLGGDVFFVRQEHRSTSLAACDVRYVVYVGDEMLLSYVGDVESHEYGRRPGAPRQVDFALRVEFPAMRGESSAQQVRVRFSICEDSDDPTIALALFGALRSALRGSSRG